MCEDLNAKAVRVVLAGLTCQHRSPVIIDMDKLQPFIDDTLDLIEFANGDSNTKWGRVRSKMGHPDPFKLEYLAVGNENWGRAYFKRYEAFAGAIRRKYPQIKLITTSGPEPGDARFAKARAWIQGTDADLIDEHLYRQPDWFLRNVNRYDNYDRALPEIFVSEYNSKGNTIKNALAEAAFMIALEENSDHIAMVSYSPLFAKDNFVQWDSPVIRFNNTDSFGSINYYLQKMFMNNMGDYTHPTKVIKAGESARAIIGMFGVGGHNTALAFDDVTIVDNRSGKTLVEENFSKGSKNWTPFSGEWEVIDGRYAQINTATADTMACIGSGNMENYTVTLKALKTGGQEGILLYFGVKDGTDHLSWNLGGDKHNSSRIEWVRNGKAATISEVDRIRSNTVAVGKWCYLKAIVKGNRIKAFVNDELIHDIVYKAKRGPLYANTTYSKTSGDIIVKVVNASHRAWDARINLNPLKPAKFTGSKIILNTASPYAQNTFAAPKKFVPTKNNIAAVPDSFTQNFAPYSITILRLQKEP